jgi:hypothetical protein
MGCVKVSSVIDNLYVVPKTTNSSSSFNTYIYITMVTLVELGMVTNKPHVVCVLLKMQDFMPYHVV